MATDKLPVDSPLTGLQVPTGLLVDVGGVGWQKEPILGRFPSDIQAPLACFCQGQMGCHVPAVSTYICGGRKRDG